VCYRINCGIRCTGYILLGGMCLSGEAGAYPWSNNGPVIFERILVYADDKWFGVWVKSPQVTSMQISQMRNSDHAFSSCKISAMSYPRLFV
jgi:hypothetical protein